MQALPSLLFSLGSPPPQFPESRAFLQTAEAIPTALSAPYHPELRTAVLQGASGPAQASHTMVYHPAREVVVQPQSAALLQATGREARLGGGV